MKLYDNVFAPNPRRVRIFMAEKDIDVPRVEVNLVKNEGRTSEFLSLNSLGQVPVLVLDDGTVITESIAICRYLEELHPRPALFGSDAVSRAKIEMWNRRVELEISRTLRDIADHSFEFFKDKVVQVPAFADAQRAAAPQKWAWLDRELSDGRPFLAGDAFSVADITGMACLIANDIAGIETPRSLTNVIRWEEHVRSRPSWKA
jgi:glutathione S-transferase